MRNKSFSLSPSDICIWVRFDRYNTIPSTGPGRVGVVEEGVGERKEEGRERKQWEERRESEEYQYGLRGKPAT